MPLSPRQIRTFNFIKAYIESNGEAPKFTEIAKYFNYKSWATVHRILRLLEEERLITRNPRLKRGIQIVPPRVCPICKLDLPVNEFGICRARKDGLNLYCKSCIRKKVYASRSALKEWKASQRRITQNKIEVQPEIATTQDQTKIAPVDEVREAIRTGSRTQREMRSKTKLGKDEIGDALAILLLQTEEIGTAGEGESRIYFLLDELVERKPCKPSTSLMEFVGCLGPRAKTVKAA